MTKTAQLTHCTNNYAIIAAKSRTHLISVPLGHISNNHNINTLEIFSNFEKEKCSFWEKYVFFSSFFFLWFSMKMRALFCWCISKWPPQPDSLLSCAVSLLRIRLPHQITLKSNELWPWLRERVNILCQSIWSIFQCVCLSDASTKPWSSKYSIIIPNFLQVCL